LSRFGRVGDVWNRDVALGLIETPSIIVATSGMMVESTPSAMIAEEMVQYAGHAIFFVGYVDPDTLGYKVLHAKKGDRIAFGLTRSSVPVRLDNIVHFHFGAHAPRRALQNIINQVRPRNVIYVHGDRDAIEWMRSETNHGCRKFCPETGETITIED
jgi:predicted metal-dependent RNase